MWTVTVYQDGTVSRFAYADLDPAYVWYDTCADDKFNDRVTLTSPGGLVLADTDCPDFQG